VNYLSRKQGVTNLNEKDEAKLFRYVYQKLYNHFGPSNWWPADTAFEICVGAILTQGVNWLNVEKAIENLKKEGLLSVYGLNNAEVKVIAGAIKPALYYNQKARKLKDFCSHLVQEHHGDLKDLFAKDSGLVRSELLSLWGIGKETADSILLYAGEHAVFVVDNYTKRLFNRLGVWQEDISYDQMQTRLIKGLPEEVDLFQEYHALIVIHGKNICMANKPKCDICPIKEFCVYHKIHSEGKN
jgi:endonuclease-3 related protein